MSAPRLTRTRTLLRDEHGASLVLALMLVMVCAVVAALVIGAAATNAERGRQHAQEEGAYYAVLSAADQGAALYRAYAPAVRMKLSSLDTAHARYTTSKLSKKDSWRRELETWTVLAATGQTKTPFTCTAHMVSEELGLGGDAQSPHVEICYQMDPTTYNVTVTARQIDADGDYANALEQVVKQNTSLSTEREDERAVSWNSKTAPALKKASHAHASAPKAGKVDKKLAALYAAWQSKKFNWKSISWKQRKDARGTKFMAVVDKKTKRVPLVWYNGSYYKATYNGTDYPTRIGEFDVRDHLLQAHPFYSGETRSGEPVSIVWQEVRLK